MLAQNLVPLKAVKPPQAGTVYVSRVRTGSEPAVTTAGVLAQHF